MTCAIVFFFFLLQFFLTEPFCSDCDMRLMLISDARRATFGVLSLVVQISGGLIPLMEPVQKRIFQR